MAYFVVESAETKELGEKAPFVAWMQSEGFSGRVLGGSLGSGTHIPWLYVDVDRREFVYGVWGAKAVGPTIGDTHLTIAEFKTVYGILRTARKRMDDMPSWQDRIAVSGALGGV